MLTGAVQLELREPPPVVRPALAVVAGVFLLLPATVGLVAAAVTGEPVPTALLVPLVMFVVPVATGLRRLLRRKRPTGMLVVDAGRIRIDLPGQPIFDAALDELRVLRAAKVGLVVGSEARALVVPAASLGSKEAPRRPADVVTAILDDVRALPPTAALPEGGARLAAQLAERDAAAGAIEKRPLVVTWGIAAVIGAVFALEMAAGAMSDGRMLLALGAARRDLVVGGVDDVVPFLGAWRIPAAALMHGHLLHLALNAMSLLVLGPVLERWLVKWRYVLVLLGSALIGTGASALLRDDVATVGLSGGLFGMLGALAITTWKYRRAPLVGPRLPLRSWVILVVANGVLTAAPGVDAWAHVGGALAGALIAWPLTPSVRALVVGGPLERVPSRVKEKVARVLAVVVLAIYVVGLAGIAHAFFTL